MANSRDRRSPRKSSSDVSADAVQAVPVVRIDVESRAGGLDSPIDLKELLRRDPTTDEARSWSALSPMLRRRAADRVALLRRWHGDRAGLTAVNAAKLADVTPNRFYQMAAAWKREPGLLAVGAYAAAPTERRTRIDPVVNASLQAGVVKVVAEGEGQTVEWMRRTLEDRVRAELADRFDGKVPIPSPNVVRAVVTREINRVGEAKLLGESIAMDCCPTTMRSPSGEPWAVFAIIDRGTLRIMGTAVGSLDRSAEGYSQAARRALLLIASERSEPKPWARRTRRADMVIGRDEDACLSMIDDYGRTEDPVEFAAVTRDKRFGSMLRQYVGDRFGRVLLRPTWASSPPPMSDGEEVFGFADAAARADFEASTYNAAKALERASGGAAPPDGLIGLLRAVIEGGAPPAS